MKTSKVFFLLKKKKKVTTEIAQSKGKKKTFFVIINLLLPEMKKKIGKNVLSQRVDTFFLLSFPPAVNIETGSIPAACGFGM